MSNRPPLILGADGQPARQPRPLLVPPSAAQAQARAQARPAPPPTYSTSDGRELPPSGLPQISREVFAAQMGGTLYGPGVTQEHAERRIVRENMAIMGLLQLVSDSIDETCSKHGAAGIHREDAKKCIRATCFAMYDMLAAQRALDLGQARIGPPQAPQTPETVPSAPAPGLNLIEE